MVTDVAGGAQGTDNKLLATIKRPHEAAGLSASIGEQLEDNPVIKKVKAGFAKMQGHVKGYGRRLAILLCVTLTNPDDARALRTLL